MYITFLHNIYIYLILYIGWTGAFPFENFVKTPLRYRRATQASNPPS